MRRILILVSLCVCVLVSSCVLIFQKGEVKEIDPTELVPSEVTEPMKAFLLDGAVVVYTEGATVTTDAILGHGLRYSLDRQSVLPVDELSLDSIIGIEAFEGWVDPLPTFLGTVLGSAGAFLGVAALSVAIFGSCPTFYASPEDGGALQAETFSYSIASQLETRDLDGIQVTPDEDGIIRLELRNEALETHYINHLELVAVEHEPGVRVVPNQDGVPIGAVDPEPPLTAVDRDGRSVLHQVVATDELAYSSSEARIQFATTEDSRDHLELTFPRPNSEVAVLLLDLRNSLLNTVLYYDLMLGSAGAKAVNWWGGSLDGIGQALEMAVWYVENMGLTVQVKNGDEWITAARMSGTGPIAWKEVGLSIPVPEQGPVHLRLSFMADDWRIDRVSLATMSDASSSELLPVHRVVSKTGKELETPRSQLAFADDQYLLTYPGQSAILEFLPTISGPGQTTTYLLAAQGYYVEWIRPEWIRSAQLTAPFQPGPGSVERLMSTWLEKKETFEDAFFGSKISVR